MKACKPVVRILKGAALAASMVVALAGSLNAQDWGNYAIISTTMGSNATRICIGESTRGDIGCPTYAPTIDTAGLVTATKITATTINAYYISGTQINGTFVGDGSALTGVVASTSDRIVSGTGGATSMVAISATGYISVTQNGTNTAYFHPQLGLVAVGVSSTGGISGTTGYFSGNVGIGKTATAYPLAVKASAATGAGFEVSGTGGQIQILQGGISSLIQSINSGLPLTINAAGATASGNSLYLQTASINRLMINSSGNVGIGTNSPTATLQVSGSFIVSTSEQNTTPSLYVSATTGRVGIGTNSPGYQFEVNQLVPSQPAIVVSGSGAATIRVNRGTLPDEAGVYFARGGTDIWRMGNLGSNVGATDYFYFNNATLGSSVLTLSTNGNVGINRVLYPNAPLEVSGTISATNLILTDTITGATLISTSNGGTVSATNVYARYISGTFTGDGSGLTGVTAGSSDRIVSGTGNATSMVAISATGYISVTQSGTNTAYFHPQLGLVAVGVSSTGTISATTLTANLISTTGSDKISSTNISTTYITIGGQPFSASGTNILVGSPLTAITNTDNTGFGYQALNSGAKGAFGANSAFGSGALKSTTGGYYNTATGYQALYSNTTGLANTANGYRAMYLNTSGQYNMASGLQALYSNTSGGYNAAGGSRGLNANTTGDYNSGFGYGALYSQENSSGQTAIGYQSMYYISGTAANAATYNTAVGYQSLMGSVTTANNTGDNNAALGYQALQGLTSGSSNTSVGYQSGYNVTSGADNVLLGTNAGDGLTSGARNIIIGAGADVPVSGQNDLLNIGNAISGSMASGGSLTLIGGLKANGVVTGTYFEGDGSRLTNLNASAIAIDRISTSGVASGATLGMVVADKGTISFTTGGTAGTAYFDTTGRLITPGISTTTAQTSVTSLYASGRVGINTTAATMPLEVNGIISATNVYVTGTTGTVSATNVYARYISGTFSGDGSGLTGVTAGSSDRIVSGTGNATSMVAISATGYISVTQSGTNTAYFHPQLGLVAVGVSSTGGLSGTTGYFTGNVGIGTASPNAKLVVNGNISATNVYVTGTTGTVSATYGYFTYISASSLSGLSLGIDNLTDAVNSGTPSPYHLFLGHNGGSAGSNDTYNLGVGATALDSLANSTALQNVGVGYNALTAITTGDYNTAVGVNALITSSAGLGSTAVGNSALMNATGNYNTATGIGALQNTSTGTSNAAEGAYALTNNTTGSNNTSIGGYSMTNQHNSAGQVAVGYQAMQYISGTAADAATFNTALGYQSLMGSVTTDNNTGDYNTALGYQALKVNESGLRNTAVGYQALVANTTGNYNTAMGWGSLIANTTGSMNIALGHSAISKQLNSTYQVAIGYNAMAFVSGTAADPAQYNIAIGYSAMTGASSTLTTGDQNTVMGYRAFESFESGSTNTLIGYISGINMTTGDYNTGLGANSLYGNVSGIANIAIGSSAVYSGQIGSGNIGIGQNTLYYTSGTAGDPSNYNTAVGTYAMSGGLGGTNLNTGDSNVAIGYYALRFVSSGSSNTMVGYQAGYNTSTGSSNTVIGQGAASGLTTGDSNILIGAGVASLHTTGSNNILIGIGSGVAASSNSTNNFLNIGNAISGSMASGGSLTLIGGLKANGVVTGTYFEGDGSRLTNLPAGTPSWYTITNIPTQVQAVSNSGNISLTNLTLTGTVSGATLISTSNGGTVSATNVYARYISGTFTGDGSGLTGVTAGSSDRIVSGTGNATSMVAISATGYISVTQSGTNTAYFHPSLGLVSVGVSTTGGISGTTGYFSSKVGVGTTAPAATLQVSGSFIVSNTVGNSAPAFYVSGSANKVGIGTATPSATLHVYNGLSLATPNSAMDDFVLEGTADVGMVQLVRNTGDGWYAFGDQDDSYVAGLYYNHANDRFDILGNNAERISIVANGNVGIATLIPSQTLHVAGTMLTTSWTYLNANVNSRVTASTPLEVSGTISATTVSVSALYVNGVQITANGGGSAVNTISLTDLLDVSASAFNLLAGPGSAGASVSGTDVANTVFGIGSLAGSGGALGYNTAFGYNALPNNGPNVGFNVAIGASALAATTGASNIGIGADAMRWGTNAGNYNLGIGRAAFPVNNTGSGNSAVGPFATMYNSVNGSYNSAFGMYALYSQTNPSGQTAIGYSSMYYISGTAGDSALYNTAVGYQSLMGSATAANNTGDNNAALGYQALQGLTSGSSNTSVGYQSGYNVTSGADNVLLGTNAGDGLTSGARNIIIGAGADVPVAGQNDLLNIGNAISGSMASGGSLTLIGGLKANGVVTATYFEGNGSRLTNIAGSSVAVAQIQDGTGQSAVTTQANGIVSITTGGVSGTAYFDTTGRLIAPGISITTAQTSVTSLYASGPVNAASYVYSGNYVLRSGFGLYYNNSSQARLDMTASTIQLLNANVGISVTAPTAKLEVNGNISASNVYVTATTGTVSATYGYFTYVSASNLNATVSMALDDLTDVSHTSASGNLYMGISSGAANAGGINNLGLGQNTLYSNTTGTSNIAIGLNSLYRNTTASTQLAIGLRALYATTGATNMGVGNDAGRYNTTGTGNAYVGYAAGYQNDTGNYNTALGSTALYGLVSSTGSYNIAIGYGSALSNYTGNYNIAMGYQSLYNNVSSSQNVAIGAFAGYGVSNSTNPSRSVFVGYQAAYTILNGERNTAVGYTAARSLTTGSYNTALGDSAAYSLNSGTYNTAIGYTAATNLTTGTYNTAIGAGAGNKLAAANNNTAVGYAALVSATGDDNVGVGMYAGQQLSTGQGNVLLGYYAGNQTTTGSYNVAIGYSNDLPSTTASNQLAIGKSIFGTSINSIEAGKIGINMRSPTTSLEVSGTISSTIVSTAALYVNGVQITTNGGGGAASAVDRISTSGVASGATLGMVVADKGTISFTTGGTAQTAYINTTGVYVGPGISATANLTSVTTLFASSYVSTVLVSSTNISATYVGVGGEVLAVSGTNFMFGGPVTGVTNTYNTGYGASALGNRPRGANGYNTAFGGLTLSNLTGGAQNTAIGYAAMLLSTVGVQNTALGYASMYYNTSGNYNVGLGSYTINSQQNSSGQVAIGYEAMHYISGTTADPALRNTAIGYQSLQGSTTATDNTGDNNVAIGHNTMGGTGLTTASSNTAIGYLAGTNITTASSNTLLGAGTANTLTTGGNNIIIGSGANVPGAAVNNFLNIGNAISGTLTSGGSVTFIGGLQANGTVSVSALYVNGVQITTNGGGGGGSSVSITDLTDATKDTTNNNLTLGVELGTLADNDYNTAVGITALDSLSNSAGANEGDYNTALGYAALTANTTGAGNTALGMNVLPANTSGGYNTANGLNALYSNISGGYNNAYGQNSLYSNTTGNYNVAYGNDTLYNQNNSAGQTAIGWQSMYYISGTAADPAQYNTALGYQSMRGGSTATNDTADQNTSIGYQSLYSVTTGSSNTTVGFQSGYNITSGADNTLLGKGAGDGLTSGARNIIIGADADAPVSGQNDFLNIGNAISGSITTGGSITFIGGAQFNGDVSYTGALSHTSDRRLKTNIVGLPENTLDTLMQLKPVSFNMLPKGRAEFGFIAQEVQPLYPRLVHSNGDVSQTLSLEYTGLIAPAIKGIQQLKIENDALKADNIKLKSRQDDLEQRLLRLEKLLQNPTPANTRPH